MKSLLRKLVGAVVGAGALTGVANAEQVIVYEAPMYGSIQAISADFAVNRELGRAWVDIQVQPVQIGSEPIFALPIERSVDGLYYDSARKQVLYQTASGAIVCAEDGATNLKGTGNCRLIPSTERRMIDDGFGVYERTIARVVLDTQATAALPAAAQR